MARRLRTYESDDIVVEYDVRRCIHAAECVAGHGEVFDPERRPWIDPGRARAETVAEVVERCPSGALTYRRLDGGPDEPVPSVNRVRPEPDGPLIVSGGLRVELSDGEVVTANRVALCRCGASANKPFCDNSHVEAGFRDPGLIQGGRLVPLDDSTETEVVLHGVTNGPLLVRGPLSVVGVDGTVSEGHKGALCRCGSSSSKPFCDGSHRRVDFEAD